MDSKQLLDNGSRLVSILTDAYKLAVLVVLSVLVIATIVRPAWARETLRDAGISLKEIDVWGVKLVANDAFDAANALAETKVALKDYAAKLGPAAIDAKHPIGRALDNLDKATASLASQSAKVNDALREAGAATPPIPQTGWLYVGRVAQDGRFTPGPRIDPIATRIDGLKVERVGLRADASVVQNGDDCSKTRLEDIHPPERHELEALQLLVAPNPSRALETVETASCPSAGGGKWLYAKVRIPPADVKFIRFESLIRKA